MSVMFPMVTTSWMLSEPLNNIKKIGLSLDSCLIALQFPDDCSISASWMSWQLLMSYWTIIRFSEANQYPQLLTLKLCCRSFCISYRSTSDVCAVALHDFSCSWGASAFSLGMGILVWGADLSFTPCGLGLCTNLLCVNWHWFQHLSGEMSRPVPGKLFWILWSFLMH